jgi:FHS family L-fucose permease-like MFS transporter
MRTYLGLAVVIVVVAMLVWLRRDRLREVRDRDRSMLGHPLALLSQPRFGFGVLCIFLYVGAEVAIGSLIVNYLSQPDILAIEPESAGKHLPLYWGGAMVGRFVGAYVLRIFSPGKVLGCAAGMVIALLLTSAHTTGALAGYSLLAIGLFNSIMFPTIFSLASEGLGRRAAEGSGIIATAIVGGAVVPWITGRVADWHGLQFALAVPALCYAGVLSFGVYTRHPLASVAG